MNYFILSYKSDPDEEYMSNGGHATGTPGFYFRYDGLLQKYEVGVRKGTQLHKVNFQLQEMYWHEVMWSYKSGDKLTLYVNGKNLKEVTGALAEAIPSASNSVAGKISIGKRSKAILDEVAFWETKVTLPTGTVDLFLTVKF